MRNMQQTSRELVLLERNMTHKGESLMDVPEKQEAAATAAPYEGDGGEKVNR